MKTNRLSLFLFAALFSAFLSAASIGFADEPTEELRDVRGTVEKIGEIGYSIVPDGEPGSRYAPTPPLAEEFQVDGLRVLFSGKVGSDDEHGGRGGRRWGTPLEVTSIERLEEADDGDDSRTSGI